MKLIFYPNNCETTHPDMTPEKAAERLNKLGCSWDAATRTFDIDLTNETFYAVWIYGVYQDGSQKLLKLVNSSDNVALSVALEESQLVGLKGFKISLTYSGASYSDAGITFISSDSEGTYIYPTGEIDAKTLPITVVGFKGHQYAESYTHIRFMVAEIQDNGEIGGDGHVWQSEPFDKDIDYTHTLAALVGICEGKELTNFNVLFELVAYNPESDGYDYIDSYIVGDATNAVTFTVKSDAVEDVVTFATLDDVAYCLSPAILTINRHENRDIQNVRVEVSNYIADFEFYPDRNLLEIDIAEYLQTLWANVDVFEYQQMQTTVVVKLYDANWNELETQGITVTSVYGKNPESEIPDNLRIQWLDKFGALHDVTFKVFQNTAEGESKQKYVSRREEREDKTGERSISLAYVNANASQRAILETIVFADHIRAYIGESWKRVRVENSYKHGTGREKRNFEITIKYSL